MKILDRYILSSYLKTFISVFVILMLIFVLQAIWLYIKELAGKDLDLITVAKFLFYITPTLIPLILPLTILLASIMVFGNFAENYEFAAMKSTGISLQRAMSGLSIFIVGLAITTFFFSNNVIPWAEYNSYNLRKNIAKLKPAMLIAEGQFNQVGEDFNIKIAKKTGDRGQFLEDIIIHQSETNKIGNFTTIIAKNGELVSEESSNILQLVLFDGYYYNDTPPKDIQERRKEPFLKSKFEKYTMNIDLSKLNEVDLDDKAYDDKYTMLNISDLSKTTDSLAEARQTTYTDFSTALYKRTNIETLNLMVDTKVDKEFTGDVIDLFSTKRQVQILEYAINSISSTSNIINSKKADLKNKNVSLNKHIIAFHEKFALAIACIILFFVGAPLGALIRKGGLGLPMIIAIVLFLSYHFIGIFAKNSAKDSSFSPILATWFSTLIMLPLSIYLTRRATADRGLFEFDHITVPLKKWFSKTFPKSKLFKSEEDSNTTLETTKSDKVTSAISDGNRSIANSTLLNYRVVSRIALTTYSIAVILLIVYFTLKNNELPQIAISALYLSVISAVIYAIHYFKTLISYRAYIKTLHVNRHKKSPALLLVGFILYPIIHFNRRRKFKADTA